MDAFIHHTSKMAREHLLLKFGKRPNIIIGSKLQRSELNNSGRLEVDPMQVCLPKFREAQSSDSKTNEEGINDPLLCTYPNSKHWLKVPLRVGT